MAETVRVVVDAMGGDNAPAEPVKSSCGSCYGKRRYQSDPYRQTGSNRE